MHLAPSDEERARAVQCIIANVSQTTLLQIYTEISNDPDWLILHHFLSAPRSGICSAAMVLIGTMLPSIMSGSRLRWQQS